MFISESYVHFQDEIVNLEENDKFVDISLDLLSLKQWSISENGKSLKRSKRLFKSEDNVHKSKRLVSIRKMNNTSNSPGYDGDTDTDPEDAACTPISLLTVCNICGLEFLNDSLSSYNNEEGEHPCKTYRKRRKDRRKVKSLLFNHENVHFIDFDDYKDYRHKMEVFDPSSERKWTLEYEYNRDNNRHTLAKIIIGRGQNDQYPEMNNIHLIQELRSYEKLDWRNKWLDGLKIKNEGLKDRYSHFPGANTCLFCFIERNNNISKSIKNQASVLFKLSSRIPKETEHSFNTRNGNDFCVGNQLDYNVLTDIQNHDQNLQIDHANEIHYSPSHGGKGDSSTFSQQYSKLTGHKQSLPQFCNNGVDLSANSKQSEKSGDAIHLGKEKNAEFETNVNKKSGKRFSSKLVKGFSKAKARAHHDDADDDQTDSDDDDFVIIL